MRWRYTLLVALVFLAGCEHSIIGVITNSKEVICKNVNGDYETVTLITVEDEQNEDHSVILAWQECNDPCSGKRYVIKYTTNCKIGGFPSVQKANQTDAPFVGDMETAKEMLAPAPGELLIDLKLDKRQLTKQLGEECVVQHLGQDKAFVIHATDKGCTKLTTANIGEDGLVTDDVSFTHDPIVIVRSQ